MHDDAPAQYVAFASGFGELLHKAAALGLAFVLTGFLVSIARLGKRCAIRFGWGSTPTTPVWTRFNLSNLVSDEDTRFILDAVPGIAACAGGVETLRSDDTATAVLLGLMKK